jgi:hypothetical protein
LDKGSTASQGLAHSRLQCHKASFRAPIYNQFAEAISDSRVPTDSRTYLGDDEFCTRILRLASAIRTDQHQTTMPSHRTHLTSAHSRALLTVAQKCGNSRPSSQRLIHRSLDLQLEDLFTCVSRHRTAIVDRSLLCRLPTTWTFQYFSWIRCGRRQPNNTAPKTG